MRSDQGLLLLSYRRPRSILTLGMLGRYGYTGDWRIVVSHDDPTLNEYYKKHGRNRVIVFRRDKVDCDYFDNLDNSRFRSVVAARNAAWEIAEALGWRRFALFDDDYDAIQLSPIFGSRRYSAHRLDRFLDRISSLFWSCLERMPADVCAISMGQTGDRSYERDSFKRKAMNSFYLLTSRRFSWVGRCNEDVSTYFGEQLRGKIFLQVNYLLVHQSRMMSRDGGSTNLYKSLGSDRIKALYSFLQWPGMVRVGYCASVGRCHHKILAHSYPYVVRR